MLQYDDLKTSPKRFAPKAWIFDLKAKNLPLVTYDCHD